MCALSERDDFVLVFTEKSLSCSDVDRQFFLVDEDDRFYMSDST